MSRLFQPSVSPREPDHPLNVKEVALPRDAPCPTCGEGEMPLHRATLVEVVSVVVTTWWRRKEIVGCTTCLERRLRQTIATTLVAGPWHPTGALRTASAVTGMLRDLRAIRRSGASRLVARPPALDATEVG